jgi:hypothetical protein
MWCDRGGVNARWVCEMLWLSKSEAKGLAGAERNVLEVDVVGTPPVGGGKLRECTIGVPCRQCR